MSFALQARRSHHKKKTLSFRITSLSFSWGGVQSQTDDLRATSATLAPQKKDAILPNNVSSFSCGGVQSRTDVLRATSATLAPQKKDAILPNNVSSFSCGGYRSRTDDLLRARQAL